MTTKPTHPHSLSSQMLSSKALAPAFMPLLWIGLLASCLTAEQPAAESLSQAGSLFQAGKTTTVTTSRKHAATYHVSLPNQYEADGISHPLLVVFSPGGNGMGMVEKIREATDAAGWILVGCDRLRNGMTDESLAVELEDEFLEDIFEKVPHDPKRVYLGGFSGGAMRAYGITARRTEPYAGVLAYGGWLGGPSYQTKPYREHMTIAMVTGTHDLGAGGWVSTDTKALRLRNCTIKHFMFDGGHSVAPAEVTHSAIDWFDRQWAAEQASPQSEIDNRISLDVLYVGSDPDRTKEFSSFLTQHFRSAQSTHPTDLTLEKANRADVLLLDSTVRSLPDGFTKAMVLTGPSAARTGERYGSKIDWLCQCLDHEAYGVDTSHVIFQRPFPVTPTLIEKRCPYTKIKIEAWAVEQPQDEPGLVSSRKHFASASDSEIISGGVNMKGISGVPIVREAHRLFWGFVGTPNEMTEEARQVFLNALTWIHEFDGERQSEFAGLHSRAKVKSVLDSPYVYASNLNRWFEQALIDDSNGDKEAIRKHFQGRLNFVHVPTGSGLLQVDAQAEAFNTPIDQIESIAKWIEMLDGENGKTAFALLQRYTQQRIRRKPKLWSQWYDENRDQLKFSEERGYRFFTQETPTESKAAKKALPTKERSAALTEVSPVLFDIGLSALETVDSVAYQYTGRTVTVVIRANVLRDWHLYAATENNGINLPTKIDLELPEGMEFVGDWKYPLATDGTLGDGAMFERKIRVGPTARDRTEIGGTIRFQACSDVRCLRPQTLAFSLPIVVMAQ